MNKICALIAAGSAMAASAPAFAQEATPASSFQGLRVQAIAGYDHSRSGSTVDLNSDRVKQSIDGVVYGGGVGYDFAVGSRLTLGADAEISDSSAKFDTNNSQPNTFTLGRVKAGRDLYFGGRIGYAVSPAALVYAKGGYTNARYNVALANGGTSETRRLDTDGYRIGAGLEYKLSQKMFVGAEYRFSSYKRAEFDYNGATADSNRFRIDTDRHQVVATAGVRF
jgi:outer membrane immunogenic protein